MSQYNNNNLYTNVNTGNRKTQLESTPPETKTLHFGLSSASGPVLTGSGGNSRNANRIVIGSSLKSERRNAPNVLFTDEVLYATTTTRNTNRKQTNPRSITGNNYAPLELQSIPNNKNNNAGEDFFDEIGQMSVNNNNNGGGVNKKFPRRKAVICRENISAPTTTKSPAFEKKFKSASVATGSRASSVPIGGVNCDHKVNQNLEKLAANASATFESSRLSVPRVVGFNSRPVLVAAGVAHGGSASADQVHEPSTAPAIKPMPKPKPKSKPKTTPEVVLLLDSDSESDDSGGDDAKVNTSTDSGVASSSANTSLARHSHSSGNAIDIPDSDTDDGNNNNDDTDGQGRCQHNQAKASRSSAVDAAAAAAGVASGAVGFMVQRSVGGDDIVSSTVANEVYGGSKDHITGTKSVSLKKFPVQELMHVGQVFRTVEDFGSVPLTVDMAVNHIDNCLDFYFHNFLRRSRYHSNNTLDQDIAQETFRNKGNAGVGAGVGDDGTKESLVTICCQLPLSLIEAVSSQPHTDRPEGSTRVLLIECIDDVLSSLFGPTGRVVPNYSCKTMSSTSRGHMAIDNNSVDGNAIVMNMSSAACEAVVRALQNLIALEITKGDPKGVGKILVSSTIKNVLYDKWDKMPFLRSAEFDKKLLAYRGTVKTSSGVGSSSHKPRSKSATTTTSAQQQESDYRTPSEKLLNSAGMRSAGVTVVGYAETQRQTLINDLNNSSHGYGVGDGDEDDFVSHVQQSVMMPHASEIPKRQLESMKSMIGVSESFDWKGVAATCSQTYSGRTTRRSSTKEEEDALLQVAAFESAQQAFPSTTYGRRTRSSTGSLHNNNSRYSGTNSCMDLYSGNVDLTAGDSPPGTKRRRTRVTQTRDAIGSRADDNEVIIRYPPEEDAQDVITINKGHCRRLVDGEYLNDSLIDFCIKRMLIDTELPCFDAHKRSLVHAFSSLFYNKLVSRDSLTLREIKALGGINYRAVARWARHINLFQKEFLFIPVNQGIHWSLFIVVRPLLWVPKFSEHISATTDEHKPSDTTKPTSPSAATMNTADDNCMDVDGKGNKAATTSASTKPDTETVATGTVATGTVATGTVATGTATDTGKASKAKRVIETVYLHPVVSNSTADTSENMPVILHLDPLTGLHGTTLISKHIKRYLIEEFKAKFEMCLSPVSVSVSAPVSARTPAPVPSPAPPAVEAAATNGIEPEPVIESMVTETPPIGTELTPVVKQPIADAVAVVGLGANEEDHRQQGEQESSAMNIDEGSSSSGSSGSGSSVSSSRSSADDTAAIAEVEPSPSPSSPATTTITTTTATAGSYVPLEVLFEMVSTAIDNTKVITMKNIPVQQNGYDCGVFVAKYAQLLYAAFPSSTAHDLANHFGDYIHRDSFDADDVLRERVMLQSLMEKLEKEYKLLTDQRAAAKRQKRAEKLAQKQQVMAGGTVVEPGACATAGAGKASTKAVPEEADRLMLADTLTDTSADIEKKEIGVTENDSVGISGSKRAADADVDVDDNSDFELMSAAPTVKSPKKQKRRRRKSSTHDISDNAAAAVVVTAAYDSGSSSSSSSSDSDSGSDSYGDSDSDSDSDSDGCELIGENKATRQASQSQSPSQSQTESHSIASELPSTQVDNISDSEGEGEGAFSWGSSQEGREREQRQKERELQKMEVENSQKAKPKPKPKSKSGASGSTLLADIPSCGVFEFGDSSNTPVLDVVDSEATAVYNVEDEDELQQQQEQEQESPGEDDQGEEEEDLRAFDHSRSKRKKCSSSSSSSSDGNGQKNGHSTDDLPARSYWFKNQKSLSELIARNGSSSSIKGQDKDYTSSADVSESTAASTTTPRVKYSGRGLSMLLSSGGSGNKVVATPTAPHEVDLVDDSDDGERSGDEDRTKGVGSSGLMETSDSISKDAASSDIDLASSDDDDEDDSSIHHRQRSSADYMTHSAKLEPDAASTAGEQISQDY